MFKTEITGNDWENGVEIRNNVYYEGFFQSDSYFQKYDSLIKRNLHSENNIEKRLKINTRSYLINHVVHFRRKDYLDVEFDGLGGRRSCFAI